MKKREHRDRQQQHLHRLGDQQHQHQVGLCRPVTSASSCEVGARRPRAAARSPSSGVSAHASSSAVVVDLVVELVDLLGQPHQQEARTASAEEQHGASHSTPAVQGRGTCHTSVLMNRNVTNSSSIGSARVASGNSSPRLREACAAAPSPAIERASQREQRVRPQHADQQPRRRPRADGAGRRSRSPTRQSAADADRQRRRRPRRTTPRRGRSRRRTCGSDVVDEVGQPVREEPRLRAAERLRRR